MVCDIYWILGVIDESGLIIYPYPVIYSSVTGLILSIVGFRVVCR